MRILSADTLAREEKLGKELKSTADSWRWKFNLPQKPNYSNVYYYRKSKKIFNAPCYDLDMDKPPHSHQGEFLQVKNALHQSEFRLNRAQEDARNKKQDLALQWKELEAKELALRNNFIQFNRFLVRNITKRGRADQKYQEMNTLKVECTEKILKMKTESEDIEEYIETLKQMIETHKVYEDFLNAVVTTGSFRTVPHIINRYTLLEETKQNVGQQMYETSEEFHTRRLLYVKLLEASHITFLSFSNELSELRRRYDDAKNRTNVWEMVLNDICNKYSAVSQNISWSRMALRHMFDMAFSRVRRRRKKLVKKQRDDLGKMLRINETMKALERIEVQLRKLYGQKSVATSMDPEPEGFEIKQSAEATKPPGAKMASASGKFRRKKKDKSVHIKGKDHGEDLEDIAETEATSENLDDVCPIRLDTEKWKFAKVKNFEERYKKALLGIREEKLREMTKALNYGGSFSNASSSYQRSHKAKWAAAAVAQKIAKEVCGGGGTEVHLPTPTTNVTVTSDGSLTVREDAGTYLLDEITDVVARRSEVKKMIERKFASFTDPTSKPRDFDVREQDKQAYALPSIVSRYQTKEKDSSLGKKQIDSMKTSPQKLPRLDIKRAKKANMKNK